MSGAERPLIAGSAAGDTGFRSVRVSAGGGGADYDVLIGPGLISKIGSLIAPMVSPGGAIAVISDSNVGKIYGEAILHALRGVDARSALHLFPAGERHKTRASWVYLTDSLLESGYGRDTLVVAVGGGVTGDLGGFVASTFLRGVPVVQIPTSLVAMIDASVGGKTGVDVSAGKNLVGAFHPPSLVIADPETIRTLPREERAQGLAEAVKHGAILDIDYLNALSDRGGALLGAELDTLVWAVHRSVELKSGVVSQDERESGVREILNFGHTLGHALEAESDFEIPHGSAVSMGMVLEARAGEMAGVTAPGTAVRLASILSPLGLPTRPPSGLDPDRVLAWTRGDKKARRGMTRYVRLAEPGRVSNVGGWSGEIREGLVLEVLQEAVQAP